jgi:hypothetical protein
MKIPFRFRKIPLYEYDYDSQFSKNKIIGRDKRMLRKKQIKRYLRDFEKE